MFIILLLTRVVVIMIKDLKTLYHKLLTSIILKIREAIELKVHLRLKMETVALYGSLMN